MTHMSSHGAFPTDRDRTSVTVEMQHLEKDTEKKNVDDTLSHPQKKTSTLTVRGYIMDSNDKQSVHNNFCRGKAILLISSHPYLDKNKIEVLLFSLQYNARKNVHPTLLSRTETICQHSPIWVCHLLHVSDNNFSCIYKHWIKLLSHLNLLLLHCAHQAKNKDNPLSNLSVNLQDRTFRGKWMQKLAITTKVSVKAKNFDNSPMQASPFSVSGTSWKKLELEGRICTL